MNNWESALVLTLSLTWLATWIVRKVVFVIRFLTTKKRAMPRQVLPRKYDV